MAAAKRCDQFVLEWNPNFLELPREAKIDSENQDFTNDCSARYQKGK